MGCCGGLPYVLVVILCYQDGVEGRETHVANTFHRVSPELHAHLSNDGVGHRLLNASQFNLHVVNTSFAEIRVLRT